MADVLVLAYHAVSDSWQSSLAVRRDDLARQLETLLERGYEPMTAGAALDGRRRDRVMAVTFDDACLSVFTAALPIMDGLGVPGTVFAPTAYIGTGRPMSWPGIERWSGGPHEHELLPMSWEQLGELQSAGWEIGSHTVSHPRLTAVADDRLHGELEDSRTALEQALGGPCESLAYPYGDHDDRVVAAAGRAGYRFAFTLPERLAPAEPLRWPRIGVYGGDSPRTYRLKVSRGVRRARASRAWGGVAAARRSVLAAGRRRTA